MMTGARRAGVAAVAGLALAATAAPAFAQSGPQTAVARMVTSGGAAAGRVDVISLEALVDVAEGEGSVGGGGEAALTGRLARQQEENFALVAATLRGLPPGFHGFHVHETGSCQGPSFTSAGGHFNPTGAMHPNHAGDMSALLVKADGEGTVALETDRFSVSDLRDADGSAVIVHELPDNYANIPARYTPQPPDATTTSTGDAGGRIACGVVR
jgi:Cu-Zn family superoxide dismutase